LHGSICSAKELAGLGLQLGADIPFFLSDGPSALATGIGEVLQPVAPLRGYAVVLVNPGFSVSTRWVYQTFALTNKDLASNLGNSLEDIGGAVGPGWPLPALSAKAHLANDLEAVTIPRYPEVERIKEELLRCGAVNALMSGSGPTVFGLFATQREAEGCADLCKRRYPRTFLVAPLEENKF
jgi:4-diphosphocytidyl-2-C-methyl-D-erythritol kinase